MNISQNVARKIKQYNGLEICFIEFEKSLKGIPSPNGYNLTIEPHDDKTKFYMSCFNRKILVNFSSFGESSSRFLGKITFEINNGKKENTVITSIHFDEHGNNYYELESHANSWSLNRDDGREPLILHVLSKYLEYMQEKMTS